MATNWHSAEAALKPHEAALAQFHPAIIRLVSQLIDSTSQEDILVFMRWCAARGQDILFPPGAATAPKARISRLGASRRVLARSIQGLA